MSKIVKLTSGVYPHALDLIKVKSTDNESVYAEHVSGGTTATARLITLRSNEVKSVSRNPLAKAPVGVSAKGGRQIVYKIEDLQKWTDGDGNAYMDPIKVTVTAEVGNGYIQHVAAGSTAAGEISKLLQKALTELISWIYSTSGGDETYVPTDGQLFIDKMLYGSVVYDNVPKQSGSSTSMKYEVDSEGFLISEVAKEADKNSK